MEGLSPIILRRTIENIVEEIESREEVILGASIAHGTRVNFFSEHVGHLNLLVYPEYGEVNYKLNSKTTFFSNAHMNPNPIIVKDMLKMVPFNSKRDGKIWFPGGHDGNELQNGIDSLILFKQNPVSNPSLHEGFKEFLDEVVPPYQQRY